MSLGPIDLGRQIDLERLDQRLQTLLGWGWDGPGQAPAPDAPPEGAAPTGWLLGRRLLAVAASLMRSAKLPVFMAGVVLEARDDGDGGGSRWTFNVLAPWTDNIPESVHRSAYHHAIQVLRWGCSREPDSSAALWQDRIHQDWVLPAAREIRESGGAGLILVLAAFCSDIPYRYLGGGFYHIGMGSRSVLSRRGGTAGDSAIGVRISASKLMTSRHLRLFGLPVTDPALVDSESQAVEIARARGWPVVIKPDDCERGEGVTTAIDSEAALRQAFRAAKGYSAKVLLDRQVSGACHRILVVRGEVVLALRRDPPRVVGDGQHSVRQLVDIQEEANLRLPAWQRCKPLPTGAELQAWLSSAGGPGPDDVPQSGQVIPLRPRESWDWGGHSELVTALMHPDNVDLARRAASALGLEVAGIDLMTQDIAVAWHQNGAAIIEVNFSPAISVNTADQKGLRRLMSALLPHGGRIPVDVVVGRTAALERGKTLQAERVAAGLRCYLANSTLVLGPDGSPVPTTFTGLYQFVWSLMLDTTVDAVVIVADDPGLADTGFPVDRIDHLETIPAELDEPLRALAEYAGKFMSGEDRPLGATVTGPA